jgi:hypothetical protein
MAEQLDISLVERQRCAIEFCKSKWNFQVVEALYRRRNESERSKTPVPLSSWSLRQAVCSTFPRSRWSVVISTSLAKGDTLKKRPSPHLHKVPTRSNKMSPRTFQTILTDIVNYCCAKPHAMEESGGRAPPILDFSTIWRLVVWRCGCFIPEKMEFGCNQRHWPGRTTGNEAVRLRESVVP